MSVVGVDIGSYSTHIAVAKLGAVEVIDNDYSLRPTPSIVAYGDRQRFVGVAAENQKNLNPRQTISNFKSCVGLNFKDVETLGDRFGATASVDTKGKLLFEVRGHELSPEQVLATLFTKVRDIVKANDDNEELIDTLVVSVPVYFTQAQRQAVKDSAAIAGLNINEVISDASALALSYGKSKDISGDEKRNVVIVDVGHEGTQAVVVEFDSQSARILASAHNNIGGRAFDDELVNHAVSIIEDKYKVSIKDNVKVLNRLRNILEKTKKQMSANTNKIPVQIDSLMDDTDVNFTIDRAEFEKMIATKIATIKETIEDLMASTTVKSEDLFSVEIVGGSTRIPAIKQVIEEVTGLQTSTTLNADEAIARGCALYAASLSSKFITKKYHITPAVHYGIEAMFVHGGQHEKVLVSDKGDSINEPVSIEITADLPLNVALQYTDSSPIEDKFISLYKVDGTEAKRGVFNLKFGFDTIGALELKEVVMTAEEQLTKKRKSVSPDRGEDMEESENDETTELVPCRTVLAFAKSMPEPRNVVELRDKEMSMIHADQVEIQRQEEKNNLEELLFKCRHEVEEHNEQLGEEEVYTNIIQFFEETENWLYEEGEGAPKSSYLDMAQTLHKKMKVFSVWVEKFQQIKAMEEEKRLFLERQQQRQQEQEEYEEQMRQNYHQQQQQRSPPRNVRKIPVVYEGDGDYVPFHQPPQAQQAPKRPSPTRFAHRPDPFFSSHPFFGDSMFGW